MSCWRRIRLVAALDLDEIFDFAPFVRYADQIVGRLDAIVSSASFAAG